MSNRAVFGLSSLIVISLAVYYAPVTSASPASVTSDEISLLPVAMADWSERFARPEDLYGVTSADRAVEILTAAHEITYYYTYTIQDARRSMPAELKDFFAAQEIGHCEVGALVFAKLLGEDFHARNFNVIAPQHGRSVPGLSDMLTYTGHTAAAVELEHGAVLIDPMFGIMLVSDRPALNDEVMKAQDFKVYSLFEASDPPEMRRAFQDNTHIYSRLAEPAAFSAYSGERMVARSSTIAVSAFGETVLGAKDGNSTDMFAILGAWSDHVGYWYEPVNHLWPIDGKWPGIYEFEMTLIDGQGPVLSEPFEVDLAVEGGVVLSTAIESRTLRVRYASLGSAVVSTSSIGMSGRRVDQVKVRQLGAF